MHNGAYLFVTDAEWEGMWSFWRWIDKYQGENCCSTFSWSELSALISCRWNPDEEITTFLPIDELVDHQSAIIDFSFYCSDSVEKPFRLLIIPIVPAGEDSEIADRFGFVCSLFQRWAKSGIESSPIQNGRPGIMICPPETTAHPFRKIQRFFLFRLSTRMPLSLCNPHVLDSLWPGKALKIVTDDIK